MSDEKFTKIAVGLLTNVRDLVHWGVEGGHTTHEELRLTVEARKVAVTKLHEQGLSQRQIAKVVGASKDTIARDLGRGANEPEIGANEPLHPKPPKPKPARDVETPRVEAPPKQNDNDEDAFTEPRAKDIDPRPIKTVVEFVGQVEACRMKVRDTVSAFIDETPQDKWLEMIAVAKASLDDLEIWAKRQINGNDGHIAPHESTKVIPGRAH